MFLLYLIYIFSNHSKHINTFRKKKNIHKVNSVLNFVIILVSQDNYNRLLKGNKL